MAFDVQTGKWVNDRPLPDLRQARCWHSSIMLGTSLYVILGNTVAGEGSIEQLDMSLHHSTNQGIDRQWILHSVSDLPPVGQCAACADPLTRKIVIFGG